jgi:hypothetical protein
MNRLTARSVCRECSRNAVSCRSTRTVRQGMTARPAFARRSGNAHPSSQTSSGRRAPRRVQDESRQGSGPRRRRTIRQRQSLLYVIVFVAHARLTSCCPRFSSPPSFFPFSFCYRLTPIQRSPPYIGALSTYAIDVSLKERHVRSNSYSLRVPLLSKIGRPDHDIDRHGSR